MLSLQKLFLSIAALLIASFASAQETWPSPEVEQMYRHAQDYMTTADYEDAIITFKHAISLAPGKMILYRDLGNALYLAGKYDEAEKTLSSLQDMPDADALCYKILAAAQAAQGSYKSAKATIRKGISRYPGAGILYYEKGVIYTQDKMPEDALLAWLDGIRQQPAYADNYREAALVYLHSHDVLWGLLYGEIYANITKDTTGMAGLKKLLFTGYKTMFDNVSEDVPEFGKIRGKNTQANNFANAVHAIYDSLTPVVSDGITTENLTMVRTRFLMDWFASCQNKFPFTLFTYMDELVRTGHFDMYNEWLFGEAESKEEFKAWNTFHQGDLERLGKWQMEHPLLPSTGDFYNNEQISGLFNHK